MLTKITSTQQPVKFSQFGADNGRVVVYFHGVPGAPEECAVFDLYAKAQGLTFICLDRFAVGAAVEGEAYYQLLAATILKLAAGEKFDVIGFSIGAFIALQTCRHLKGNVRNLHLVSAAAPLEAGDFLKTMTGQQVFRLAKASPSLLALLAYGQKSIALCCPALLFKMMFASAAGADMALVTDLVFQARLVKVLKACFTQPVQGYTRDIRAYVRPWASILADISVNTIIWHGEADNWSPRLMANYLQSALPNDPKIEMLTGLSHYACLYDAAPKLCELLGAPNLNPDRITVEHNACHIPI